MTWRYYHWLAQQARADLALLKLGLIAFSLVAAWSLLPLLPPAAQRVLRPLYLVGGLLLYAGGIALTYFNLGGKP
jgi:hypothetical protein